MQAGIIVLADDDDRVAADLERDVRRRYGDEYRVVHAPRGDEALALCRRLDGPGTPVALVVAAENLPDGPGTAFLVRARTVCPRAGRALLTGHPDAEAAVIAVNDVGIDRCLVKPWASPEETLYPALDELLADWRARAALPYTRVADVMETGIARLPAGADLATAAQTAARTRVGDLMVVDDDGGFVGVLSEGDILRASLPDLDEILAAGGTLFDGYQLFMAKSRDLSARPIDPLVIRQPLVMRPDDHVAKAATVLIDRQIRLLPVVDDGRLVGTVSRANICRAVVEAA